MARKRIQGITIELDGETQGLNKALQDVNKRSRDLQSELREVDRALKFNPGNTELLAQKQQLLAEQVENTTEKLNRLKKAQEQVEQQYKSGDIGVEQYRAFQREIIKTESQLDGFKKELASLDDNKAADNLRKDFNNIQKEAGEAKESIKDVGSELGNMIAGIAAGGGIAGAIDQALDTSSLNTKINISMEVPPESVQAVKEAINTVSSYGVDAEEALEGVRRQWALNADASDEANAKIVEGAGAIASAYAGIDFTELIQETNEISRELGITNEEALGLTNALLKIGFPPEQLDIIAEYGMQLTNAGYSAQEVQAIMAAGVETGTWNIDNLLDGLKEGRIRLAEFGQEVPKATKELLANTEISTQQLQEWGQAVAEGGEKGNQAMQEVAQAIMEVDDETTRNALGVQIFGTMWEDQGTNITETLLGMNDHLTNVKDNQDQLNESINTLNADPAVQMQKALSDMKEALQPLLLAIADFVAKIAEWIQNNPKLAATIAAVVSAIAILMGIFLALAPIVTALVTAAGALGIGLLPLIGIVAAIVLAITALIAIGIALWKNWDTVKQKASEIWGAIKEFFANLWKSIKTTAQNAWNGIKNWLSQTWQSIKNTVTNVWNSIKNFFSNLWNGIKSIFSTVISSVVNFVVTRFNNLRNNISDIFNRVRSIVSGIWNGIRSFFSSIVSNIVSSVVNRFNSLRNGVSNVMNRVRSTISNIWNRVMDFFRGINLYSIGKDIIQGLINGIKSMGRWVRDAIADLAGWIPNWIKRKLGIASPSKVMMELGKNTAEGFAIGIRNALSEVSRQANALANSTVKTVQSPMNQRVTPYQSVNDSRAIALLQEIANGIRAGQVIVMDERVVGRIIEPRITEIQERNKTRRGRFAT